MIRPRKIRISTCFRSSIVIERYEEDSSHASLKFLAFLRFSFFPPLPFSFDPCFFLSFFSTRFVCLYTSNGDERIRGKIRREFSFCIRSRVSQVFRTCTVILEFPEFFFYICFFIRLQYFLPTLIPVYIKTFLLLEFNLSLPLISINHIPPRVSYLHNRVRFIRQSSIFHPC